MTTTGYATFSHPVAALIVGFLWLIAMIVLGVFLVRGEEGDAMTIDPDTVPSLRCPACGGRIVTRTETRGQFGCTEDFPCGFECDRCWTEWDMLGDVSYVFESKLKEALSK